VQIIYAYDELLPSTATDTEQVMNTVSALAQIGVDVELRIPAPPGRPIPTREALTAYYGVKGRYSVTKFPTRFDTMRPLQKAAHAATVARRSSPKDAVWYTRNLPCLAAGLAAGYRVAFDHWRPWPDQYPPLQLPLRQAMRHPRFLGAILHSDHARESYARIGIPAERLTTIHNGYDPLRLEPRLGREEARRQLGLPVEGNIATYAGRVHARKGIGSLLQLARDCPEVTVVIVGSEGEGDVEREARRLSNVRVVPWQAFDRTTPYLYASDVLLLPLTLAPLEVHGTAVLPMKLFLYLATGRPVLAPRAPDTRELLSDDNAALVAPDDPAAAAVALRRLLRDDAWRKRLSKHAVETTRELTWERRAGKIVAFLEERMAAPRSRATGGASWSVGKWVGESWRWVRG
jgi:glycosyltransferase involved in cell wall biosynthesis